MWSFRKEIHKINNIGLLPDPPCDLGMDVAFLIDYTGSMGGVIEEVKTSIANIASAIEAQSNPNSYRLGLAISDEVNKGANPSYSGSTGYTSLPPSQRNVVTTGPSTDQYNTAMEMFNTLDNEISFTAALNTINTGSFPLGGGVNGPEPLDIALDIVVNSDFLNPFRVNKARYVLIFTDNLPGGDDDTYNSVDDAKIATLTQDCIDNKIKVFVLGGGASNPVWQNLATNTGGNYNLSFDGSVIISQIVATCQDLEPPTAIASSDQTIMLPNSSTVINGTSSFDSDGTVVSYLWEVITGPSGSSFTNPNSASTTINNLQEGTYNIRLTVTDNDGLQDTDFIALTVEPEPIPDLVINEEQEQLTDGSCTTCASVTVNVPSGQTRQVEFVKSGIGPYGAPGSLCSNTGTGVGSDNIYNISSDTTFDFGVDAARGGTGTNTATTTISLTVRDGTTVLDTYTLSRSHRNPVINC